MIMVIFVQFVLYILFPFFQLSVTSSYLILSKDILKVDRIQDAKKRLQCQECCILWLFWTVM